MDFLDYLRVVPNPAFYSVRITKLNAVSYLQQYRQYQWLAASRGLLLDTVPKGRSMPLSPTRTILRYYLQHLTTMFPIATNMPQAS